MQAPEKPVSKTGEMKKGRTLRGSVTAPLRGSLRDRC